MAKQDLTTPGPWGEIARDTMTRPRAAARRLLALDLGLGELLGAALAISCCGILLAYATMRLGPGMIDDVSTRLLSTPLMAAGLEFAVMLTVAWLTWKVGRLFGGKGTLAGAAMLVVWLNGMLLGIQALQLVSLALLPPLAAALALAGMVWALWVFANFVTELHEFKNPLMVMGGMALTGLVLVIVLGIVFAILGLAPHEVG